MGATQRVAEWFGFARADEPGPSDPSTALNIPSRAEAGRSVSHREALGLGAVFRAVQVIDIAAKQLTVHAERRGQRVTDRVPSIIVSPSVDVSRAVFIEQTTVSMACDGNAFWLKDFLDDGRIGNLNVLNPLDVQIEYTRKGTVTGYWYLGDYYTPDRIKHLKLLRVPGMIRGLGPIQAAQAELRGALDTTEMASSFFPHSGVPANGYLTTDQMITADQATDTRQRWLDATANRNGIPVIGAGTKYVSMFLSAKDAQWVEARQFDTTGAARLFGMPASIMLASVEGNSQSYSNIEQDFIWFTRFTLSSYTVEIEEAWSDLLPYGMRARFNLDSLLRTDTKTRYEAHQIGRAAGFLTINEVRALEGLAPVAGGDQLVTTQMKEAV
jgi:HK97 family phage portal protein